MTRFSVSHEIRGGVGREKKEKYPQLTFMSCEKVQRETLKGFYNHMKPRKECLTH